jgi:hypothetical protein
MSEENEELEVESEVTASEPVETVQSETTCSNCDNSGKFCAVCSSREVKEDVV